MWMPVENWDRVGGAEGVEVPRDGKPLTLPTLPRQSHKAAGYLCGESGQSHDRKNPDSFWSQCGNMSSQEEAGIKRRGGKPRGG